MPNIELIHVLLQSEILFAPLKCRYAILIIIVISHSLLEIHTIHILGKRSQYRLYKSWISLALLLNVSVEVWVADKTTPHDRHQGLIEQIWLPVEADYFLEILLLLFCLISQLLFKISAGTAVPLLRFEVDQLPVTLSLLHIVEAFAQFRGHLCIFYIEVIAEKHVVFHLIFIVTNLFEDILFS